METNEILYTLPYTPRPSARPRFSKRSGAIYDSQKDLKFSYGLQLVRRHGIRPLYSGFIRLDVTFFMPIPKSYQRGKAHTIMGTYHNFKPDLSNLIKLVEDVALGILYKDDCIISQIYAQKRYDDGMGPRTEFTLRELC